MKDEEVVFLRAYYYNNDACSTHRSTMNDIMTYLLRAGFVCVWGSFFVCIMRCVWRSFARSYCMHTYYM